MKHEIDIRAVAFKGEHSWIVQCVDYDIAAFAESPSQLYRALSDALFANLCINTHLGREALQGIPTAPARFREMFESSTAALAPVTKDQIFPPLLHLSEMRVA